MTSVHADMLAQHASDPVTFDRGGPPTILRTPSGEITSTADAVDPSIVALDEGGVTALPNGMRREVIGFLPYWMLDDTSLAELNYQLVSTIAYFSVSARPDGYLNKGTAAAPSAGWAGWTSSHMTRVIDRAHAAGGKVVLTVTMMAWNTTSWDQMRTLLSSSTARTRLVAQIVDAVRSRGADGVNLDFELVPTDMRAQYTSFVRQLKAGLVAAGVGSSLTVCTTGGAASWATGYDVTGLAAPGAADALFVMGYDFNWSGSARAGGVAPIDSPYVLDVSTAMADFLRQVPASKVIWGVPYYGRGWNTTSNALNAPTTGDSFAYHYTGHQRDATTYGRRWDDVGKVPWYRYYDSAKASWVQAYYDDAVSLGVKYDLVNRHNLRGAGIWHLLMDGTSEDLWRLLADRFVNDTRPPAGGIVTLPQTTTENAITVAWRAIDYQSGLSHYNVQVRDRATSTWKSWLIGTRATSAVYLGVPGITYEFRVQAVDLRGNAQPWTVAPGRPPSVRSGAFASVTTPSLNVRSGPGTGYGALEALAGGERVYVMTGPVSADGLAWYQVQYGFQEWPSAEYASIGWVAAGSGTSRYLAPAYAPSLTRLAPFFGGYARTATALSPNDDGVQDVVSIRYTLAAPASAMRLEVVSPSGTVIRQVSLGAQPTGPGQVSWDGRLGDGSAAPDGRYLLMLIGTDAWGRTHVAPSSSLAQSILDTFGVSVDLRAPTLVTADPLPGAGMLPASRAMSLTFDEPIGPVAPEAVVLSSAGVELTVSSVISGSGRTLVVTPSVPLPVDAVISLSVDGARDVAGNALPTWSATFSTAPGTLFRPFARLHVEPGMHTGYAIGVAGDVTAIRSMRFTSPSGAAVSQRATLPNLPGRWLYVENGVWGRMWLPESALLWTTGETERLNVPGTTRLAFAAGTHVGYRFDTAGTVVATRSVRLYSASGANTSARAVINGRWHWLVTNGIWAGYWVRESASVHRVGYVDRQQLPTLPRIRFEAGSYIGYVYDSAGTRLSRRVVSLATASGAPIEAAAIINGRQHYLVAAGILRGTWVPTDWRITLAP